MEQVTNIKVPIGGDKAPKAKLKITTMAKWISSKPKCLANGTNNGTKMIMAALPSINMPIMSKKTLTHNKNNSLLSM